MLGFIASAYVVHAVSATTTPLYLDARRVTCSAAATKPATLSLARNGTVATIFPTDYVYGGGARDVFIERRDGSRVRLTVPAPAMLSRVFHIYEKKNGLPNFQDIYFQSVRLAADGTPLATVVSHFWGGYMGIETAALRWNGATWREVPARNAMLPNALNGDEAINVGVAAADTADRAAFNGTYAQKWHPNFDRRNDPRYLPDRAEFADGARVVSLGTGTATAIRGSTVVGYRAGQNPFGPTCEMPRRTYAVKWTNGRSHSLGAGVANDVDGAGRTVGDDEEYLGARGRPVLWRDGHTFVLDRVDGSAYAISDDGTIVGRVGDTAFVADARHPNAAVTLLDDRIANGGWHLSAAYGIAGSGRILAVGMRDGGKPQILVLDPK